MPTALDEIIKRLTKDAQSAQDTVRYLNCKPVQRSQVEQAFSKVLETLGKKKLSSIATLVGKIEKTESEFWYASDMLKPKEKMAVLYHPLLAQKIKKFSLANCKLTLLPEEIIHFSSLTDLDLALNKMASFSPNLIKIQSIKKIRLSNNHLTFYPEELTQLRNLEELELNNNKIQSLPTSISNLQNLSSLDLSANRLSQLPPQITELKKLATLLLSDNKLKSLPENFGALSNLKQLNLWSWKNRIKSIPPSFGKLKNLEFLSLCSSEYMDNLKHIFDCTNLRILSLGLGKNEEIPPEIGGLNQLIRLEIYGASKKPLIKTLPERIGELTALKRLALYDLHNLQALPNTLSKLKNLQTLDVVGHSISKSDQASISQLLPNCTMRF